MPYMPSAKKEARHDSDSETKEEKASSLFKMPDVGALTTSKDMFPLPPVWGPKSMRRRHCIQCRQSGPSVLFTFCHGRGPYLQGPYCDPGQGMKGCRLRLKSEGYRDGPALPGHSPPRAWGLHD